MYVVPLLCIIEYALHFVDDLVKTQAEAELMPYEEKSLVFYDSIAIENDNEDDNDNDKDLVEREEEETNHFDVDGGWGRIIFPPVRRGRPMAMDITDRILKLGYCSPKYPLHTFSILVETSWRNGELWAARRKFKNTTTVGAISMEMITSHLFQFVAVALVNSARRLWLSGSGRARRLWGVVVAMVGDGVELEIEIEI
ncbi:hypothetical protein Ddye_009684 [Dipteronia dyeriana]|uniref:Uncharacterized protein n=1 Tax=Dipteronia dyeriana TaxID=168575 RepID=A0AAD9XC78_9ROSI|nr:hypothetical protein Ddye_009684 [Dipteronia dyeriana]